MNDKTTDAKTQAAQVASRVSDPDTEWINPHDVWPDISAIERAIIAARNIRLWAEWLLESAGPAPEKGKSLVDVVGEENQ